METIVENEESSFVTEEKYQKEMVKQFDDYEKEITKTYTLQDTVAEARIAFKKIKQFS